VRTLAKAATEKLTEKLTARPKRVISRAKARVQSLLHRSSRQTA
jgi:hypothetical protein